VLDGLGGLPADGLAVGLGELTIAVAGADPTTAMTRLHDWFFHCRGGDAATRGRDRGVRRMTAPAPRLRLLLVGYGRMGRLVDALSESYGFEVVGRLEEANNAGGSGLAAMPATPADVAIDFSIAEAFVENFPRLASLGMNVVAGTTGWNAEEARLRVVAADAGIGVVEAPNFSVGVALFQALVASSGACSRPATVMARGFTNSITRPSATRRPARRSRCGLRCSRAASREASTLPRVAPGTNPVPTPSATTARATA
jgi:hypothetical protein